MEKLYNSGITKKLDLNCAETIIYICNKQYKMGLSDADMKLSSAFGGGMCREERCGALTAGLMVLGYLFVKDRCHESDFTSKIVNEYFDIYQDKMGSIECNELKKQHRTEESGCRTVILYSLECIENIVNKYHKQLVR